MTSRKSKTRYLPLIVVASAAAILAVTWDSCGIDHVLLAGEVSRYYESLDPEMCESVLYRIDKFNAQCSPEIDMLDCG